MKITKQTIEELAYGSLILGAGGGGSEESGIKSGTESLSFGTPQMISPDTLSDDDIVVTISGVGSPASLDAYYDASNYQDIVNQITVALGKKPAALIPSEMGGASSFGPFVASASNDIPILNAAGNGRAHPLGTMGSMGLSSDKSYKTIQTAAGGNPDHFRKVELTATGSVSSTANLVLQASVEAGGVVVVARNPVSVKYIKEHAAVGCYSQAHELGKAYLEQTTAKGKISAVADYLHAELVCSGEVKNRVLNTVNGLDAGKFQIQDKKVYTLHYLNEYMAIDEDEKRICTFPDFMMTFDSKTGKPITTAHIKPGQDITVLKADYTNLILGAGMFEQDGYKYVEEALQIELIPYIEELFKK